MFKRKSLLRFLLTLPTEQDCIDYLEKCLWDGNPISPYDPTAKVWKLADGYYRCSKTKKRFNVKSGTIFKNSKIPLVDWFWALYRFLSKKGISSCQLAKELGITQKSTWNMLKDIRENLNQFKFINELEGVIELDETLVGGSNPNRHRDKKFPNCQGRSYVDKTPVLGILERGGYLILVVVPDTKLRTLEPIINSHIKVGSTIYTDELYRYSKLYRRFIHQWINHKAKQYVNGEVTTNAIENVWTHFKILIHGTYHNNISDKYLQNYADEFTFHFNTRNYSERDRFDLALSSIMGKNLTYRETVY